MQKQIIFDNWLRIHTNDGDLYLPYDLCSCDDPLDEEIKQYLPEGFLPNCEINEVEPISGYGARLSMPGYLDCTEWAVFDTYDEASDYLDEMYGLD